MVFSWLPRPVLVDEYGRVDRFLSHPAVERVQCPRERFEFLPFAGVSLVVEEARLPVRCVREAFQANAGLEKAL